MQANDFIGLTKKQSQNKAESLNLIFRLIRVDQTAFFDYPEDKREDRVCVELDDGVVTKVSIQ